MIKKKNAAIMFTTLMIFLAIMIALVIITTVLPIIQEKSGGILSLFTGKTNDDYDSNDATNVVSELYKDHSYSFLFVEADCDNQNHDAKNPISNKYNGFDHNFKSGCDLGHELPGYLAADGCWILSIERDTWLTGGGDDCGNYFFKDFILNDDSPNCKDMGRSDSCSNNALEVIKKFLNNQPNFNFNRNANSIKVKPGQRWLCGKQRNGPKVWFLCDEELAEKQGDTNLTLFQGLNKKSVYYKCSCPDNNCEWKKLP